MQSNLHLAKLHRSITSSNHLQINFYESVLVWLLNEQDCSTYIQSYVERILKQSNLVMNEESNNLKF